MRYAIVVEKTETIIPPMFPICPVAWLPDRR